MIKLKSKKILISLAIIIATVFILFKLAGGVLVFSYLKPTYLPPGIAITEDRINATDQSVSTELNFRTVDWVYEIQEYKVSEAPSTPAKGNYNPLSVNQTCSYYKSPKGKQYRLCHSVDYGKISVYEVTQINGNTFISSNMPEPLGHVITDGEIGKFVDSFKQTPRLFTPTFRSNGP